MFSPRNLMIFWGQRRTYPSSGYYCRFIQSKASLGPGLGNLTPNQDNQLVVYKNTSRKKGKVKTGSFHDGENCISFFCGANKNALISPVDRKNTQEPRSSLDEFFVRTKLLKKSGGPLFTIPTRTTGRVYTRNLTGGPLTSTITNTLHDSSGDVCFNNIRRGFHTTGLCLNASKKSNKQPSKTNSDPWLNLEGYRIYPWSISGLETSVVVRAENDKKFGVTFDLGYSTRPSVRCQHVFISHGHMDHCSGLFQHACKRNLYKLPPATYYVPPILVDSLHEIGKNLHALSGMPDILLNLDIRPIQPGDSVLVTSDYKICPFKTKHRVDSQGYLLYRQYKRLKPLYQHLKPKEVAEMEKNSIGENIYEVSWIPELAYTGDTTFELFLDHPPPDLLKVRVLILEATYLENVTPGLVDLARQRGHTHISEIIEHANLFADIEKIIPIHFSDKYSSSFARDSINYLMPPSLLKKVVISTLAKDRS